MRTYCMRLNKTAVRHYRCYEASRCYHACITASRCSTNSWRIVLSQEKSNIYFMPSGDGVCVETCPLVTNYTQFICYDEVFTDIVDNVTGEVGGYRFIYTEGATSCMRPVILGRQGLFCGWYISFRLGGGQSRGQTAV